jgi:hypothetical protein
MPTSFPDFQAAPNQGARPDLYELENQALDPDGVVLAAMRELAPWAGRTLVDLGLRQRLLAGRLRRRGRRRHRGRAGPGATGLSYGYVLFTIR